MNTLDKILIVDDEAPLRMNLRALLEDLGFSILEASSGPEALKVCALERPDLMLLDIRMPGMDGFEICSRLKADPALCTIPVMFLSGMLEALDKVKAFQVGGVDYITKPFHVEEVVARVQTHLELLRQRRKLEEQNEALEASLQETKLLNRKFIEINERLRESEELKGQFLSNMRNEINNPLNVILALGVELEEGKIPIDRCRQVGSLIATEASDLDFEIRNIFCAAELEAGEAFPCIHPVDAASVLRDVIDSHRHQARAKAMQVRLDVSGSADARFNTDADKLHIIAANLLSNGIKFGPEGGTVEIRLRVQTGSLLLEVEDHGAGIQPEDQTLIFERFRQLETGHSRAHQGQGLGLAVVKALVDLLDGSITVSSQPGLGSVFTCSLPERESSDPTDTPSLDGNLFFFGNAEEV